MRGNTAAVGRAQSGSLGALTIAVIVLCAFGLGALGVDFAHMEAVRTRLQNAADAAALAGAQDLVNDPDNVEMHALQVAATNNADGRAVSNDSPGTTVTVAVVPSSLDDPGQCTVSAHMEVRHLLAPIFGRQVDTLSVTATAGGTPTLTRVSANQAFPLAVSIDAIPPALSGGGGEGNGNGNGKGKGNGGGSDEEPGVPLNQLDVGDTVKFDINSQQYKNAAWTSFTHHPVNANWLHQAIDQQLGFAEPVPGFIPSVKVGDNIYLDNGVSGLKSLADEPYRTELLAKPVVYIPVIEGNPPYNQSRRVIGFVAVKVIDIQTNESGGRVETFTCVLLKGLTNGTGGEIPSTGNLVNDAALTRLSPGATKLIGNTTT